MNMTELAHWRYRVKALAVDIQETKRVLIQAGAEPLFAGEVRELQAQLDFERWLLEEARYKVILGETEIADRPTASVMKLSRIIEAHNVYEDALRLRQHGAVAAGHFIRAVTEVIGK